MTEPTAAFRRVAVLGLFSAFCCFAQTGSPDHFDVASLKRSPAGRPARSTSGGGPGTRDPGRFFLHNAPLTFAVMRAYDVKDTLSIAQLDWMDTERYDIDANVPSGAGAEQFRRMLQNLLVERFDLKVRWETRGLPGYDLSVAQGGPKLTVSAAPDPDRDDGLEAAPRSHPPVKIGKDGMAALPPGNAPADIMTAAGHIIRAQHKTLDDIAAMLTRQLSAPVRNLTGIPGAFDYTLFWRFERRSPGPVAGPTLFLALKQQLGLKLEPAKKPIALRVLVVERARKTPKEN